MSFLEKKLGKFAGDALSKINDMSRRRNNDNNNNIGTTSNQGQMEELETLRGATPASLNQQQHTQPTIGFNLSTNSQQAIRKTPFAGGIPFGGDTHTFGPAPVIGFKTDLLSDDQQELKQTPAAAHSRVKQQVSQLSSSESLYNGDFQSRSQFLRVFFLCLIRLSLFIGKVYQDFQATKYYNFIGLTGHFIVSAAILFLPTVVFTIYRISRYLQLRLPQLRMNTNNLLAIKTTEHDDPHRQSSDNDAGRVQKAMARQASSSAPSPSQADDEGLVTARQTPTIEEFHDSKSTQQPDQSSLYDNEPNKEHENKQDVATRSSPSAPPERPRRDQRSAQSQSSILAAPVQPKLESVNIEKFGDLPDKQVTSLVIGASEQLLHGILFIFWQLKRQVDVLSYLIERACLWRAPAKRELEQLDRLRTGSDGLEWFQDFYAAFLAILTQVYTLGLYGSSHEALKPELINSATSGLQSSPSLTTTTGSNALIDRVNHMAVNRLGQSLEYKDVIVVSELLVSSLVVMSLLIAVRRRDDGWLTLGLSSLGWGSLFSARIVTLALAFVYLGWPIMSALVVLHLLAISVWIYKIALDSHNDKASERQHEAIWDEDVEAEVRREEEEEEEAAAAAAETVDEQQTDSKKVVATTTATATTISKTSRWTVAEHLVLFLQIFTLFALPSLFYWPIMFNLKLHSRPFKYLLIILIQNFLLIPAIWYRMQGPSSGQLYLLGAMGALSITGFMFIALYVACKPDLTEYFASADMQFNQAEQAGVYYEFCSRVFKMPDLSKDSFKRLLNQEMRIVEEQTIVEGGAS